MKMDNREQWKSSTTTKAEGFEEQLCDQVVFMMELAMGRFFLIYLFYFFFMFAP